MVMTSGQISAQIGAFQQQSMMQTQAAGMLSQYGGSQQASHQLGGRALNTAGAIGGGVMDVAQGMLSPGSLALSGAISGAMSGGGMGAIASRAAMGGVAGLAMAPAMMAGQYASGQIFQGMQQQQQLQSTMGQAFQFSNQFGGRGFTEQDMSGVGQMFRQMSSQRGPGGEQVSFNELTQLTANMGRMGMANNVRDLKDFQSKFKEMLSTVKEVATAFHTSLEEAQEIMVSMRSSGIFRNQGQVAQQVRNMALGGGLATSEVTGMMNTGSQISRMIGGRGQAGAMGGMQAIGNVGAALQIGTLSEEDIFNATGLQGAEGRRAFATNMLQQDAQFLRGGRGRRLVAAMAGKDGQLNEESVNEMLYGGGMTTGQTMQHAYKNLGEVGRANFVRNEGRLRGEVLGKFGGLAKAMTYKGWLEGRGMDINDDRSMYYLQSREGMGADEAESMMKMVRDLPMLVSARENRIDDANYQSRLEYRESNKGISGLKKKFESAKKDIDNSLRQAGANLYDGLVDDIEGLINRVSGDVVTLNAQNVAETARNLFSAGGAGRMARRNLGLEGPGVASFGGGGLGLQQVGVREAFAQSGGLKQLDKAGYGIHSTDDAGFRRDFAYQQKLERSFIEGSVDSGSDLFQQGSDLQAKIRGGIARGQVEGRGSERVNSFMRFAQQSGDSRLQAIAKQMSSAGTEVEKRRIMGQVMGGAGYTGGMGMPSTGLMNLSGARSKGELLDKISAGVEGMNFGSGAGRSEEGGYDDALKEERFVDKMGGAQIGMNLLSGSFVSAGLAAGMDYGRRKIMEPVGYDDALKEERFVDKMGGAQIGMNLLSGNLVGAGLAAGMDYGRRKIMGDAQSRAAGRTGALDQVGRRAYASYQLSEEGIASGRAAFSKDATVRNAELERLEEANAKLVQDGTKVSELSSAEQGLFRARQIQMAGAKAVGIAQDKYKGDASKLTDEDLKGLAKDYTGGDLEGLRAALGGQSAVLSAEEEKKREEVFNRVSEGATGQWKDLLRGGTLDAKGELSADFQKTLKEGGVGEAGLEAARKITEAMKLKAKMTGGGEAAEAAFQGADELTEEAMEGISGMSVAEKRKFAKALSGSGMTGLQATAFREASIQEKLQQYGARGVGGYGVATQIGATVKDRRGFEKLDAGKQANELAEQLGLGSGEGDQEAKKDLQKALELQKAGKSGEASALLRGLQDNPAVQEARARKQDESAKMNDPTVRAVERVIEKLGSGIVVSRIDSAVETKDSSGAEDNAGGKKP